MLRFHLILEPGFISLSVVRAVTISMPSSAASIMPFVDSAEFGRFQVDKYDNVFPYKLFWSFTSLKAFLFVFVAFH
jgi:hypothetical protein